LFVVQLHGGYGVGGMVGIQVRASDGLALTGVGGIALLGNLLERYTDFQSSFTGAFTKRRDGIPWGDVLLAYGGRWKHLGLPRWVMFRKAPCRSAPSVQKTHVFAQIGARLAGFLRTSRIQVY
jgi:hypothetical protein